MTRPESPYYPRRANFFSPLLSWGDACHRLWRRADLFLAGKVTVRGIIASVFIPGFAFYLRGPRRSGLAAMGVCALLALLFMASPGLRERPACEAARSHSSIVPRSSYSP